MLALIRRLLVGPYYCLILQSGARWGEEMGGEGRVNLKEKEQGGAVFPVNCSKTGIPPQTLGAEAARAHRALAPQSQRSLGEICRPSHQASPQG